MHLFSNTINLTGKRLSKIIKKRRRKNFLLRKAIVGIGEAAKVAFYVLAPFRPFLGLAHWSN